VTARQPEVTAASPAGLLGQLAGRRVLDVGTGKGQFVQTLVDELGSYTEIIGIDVSDAGAEGFRQAFGARPSVRFVVADAAAMPFDDESFDTVAISGSLHHLADPTRVLTEMRRVLKSGGAFILYEQVRDRPAAAELTHIRFHEWSEEVLGVAFHPTYRKDELTDIATSMGLVRLQTVEDRDDSDPLDPGRLQRYDGFIGELLEQASDRRQLVRRGRAIRSRLHRVGIAVSPALFLLGFKQ
jgi:SAM-dependent methyltransferase